MTSIFFIKMLIGRLPVNFMKWYHYWLNKYILGKSKVDIMIHSFYNVKYVLIVTELE